MQTRTVTADGVVNRSLVSVH